jgi:hypothetical protein
MKAFQLCSDKAAAFLKRPRGLVEIDLKLEGLTKKKAKEKNQGKEPRKRTKEKNQEKASQKGSGVRLRRKIRKLLKREGRGEKKNFCLSFHAQKYFKISKE